VQDAPVRPVGIGPCDPLSAGWVCIATLATVDPVRWRTICYALSDTFALMIKTLEAMTLSYGRRQLETSDRNQVADDGTVTAKS